MKLIESGRKLLEILVPHLKKVIPGKPETYLSYKFVHDQLKLPYLGPTWGESLKKQGLAALADWTYANDHPGITGIIINSESYEPGKGYFKLFKREDGDYKWWEDEIRKSKLYDWSPYIDDVFDLVPTDYDAPERKDTSVSRIIRDSSLSARVKSINKNECQVCGTALAMPEGRRYSEAHHIQPLGKPHDGPDVADNMICVCPNHHALLDYGAIPLDISKLRFKEGHVIAEEFIRYHNEKIHKP